MFSFKRGKPIAIIKGGKYNGKILRLYEPTREEKIKLERDMYDPLDILTNKEIYDGYKRPNILRMEKLKKAIINEQEPLEEDLSEMYKIAKSLIDSTAQKEFILNDGEMQPLPCPTERECIYVSAPSGSGKSTYSRNYIMQYKKMFPDNPVYVFSRLNEDPALDDLDITRMKIDDELVEDPIDLNDNELNDSLVLFDDTDTIQDNAQKKAVLKLKEDLLEAGRKKNIYVINTSHQINNYKETRIVLNESRGVTFFPESSGVYSITYFLKKYCGLDRKMINKILKLPSRWVTIYKHYPMYVIYQGGAFLLSRT